MLNFFRLILGYVEFEIIGKYPERFINITIRNGVPIFSTRRIDKKLFGCMYIKDYRAVRPYAKKSRVRLKIHSKHGFPFVLKRYKNRVGVILGVAVFIAVVIFMSNFVWSIDVTGLETVSYSHLMNVLEENGLEVGTFKPSVNFVKIARDTMLDIDDIRFLAVNVQGSYASVEVKEKEKSPDVPDYKTPANVKAKCDGLILSIDTHQGFALFEEGSAVVKDQLLVSAVKEDARGGVKMLRASADVIAQTHRKKSFVVEKEVVTKSFSDMKSRKAISVFNVDIPYRFSFCDEESSFVRYHSENLRLFESTLPCEVNTQNIYPYVKRKVVLSKEKAKEILLKKSTLFESFELSECEIQKIERSFSQTDEKYIMDVSYTLVEDIAYQQEIDVKDMKFEDFVPSDKEE